MTHLLKRAVRKLFWTTVRRHATTEVRIGIDYLRAGSGQAFPRRPVLVTGSVEPGRVLVLSPHPDDEAIGMGASLSMHREAGSEVTVLYLADGAGLVGDREQTIGIRRREAEAAGRAFGFRQIFWNETDTRVNSTPEAVDRLVQVLRSVRPTAVYLPSFFDSHFDHVATNRLLVDALDRSDASFSVYGYEVWDNLPFPNLIVDVTTHAKRKEQLLAHYELPLESTDFIQMIRLRGRLHYMLHVDSARTAPPNASAEAFHCFESRTYGELFRAYFDILEAGQSPIVEHFEALRPA
jgi:LmbE family N-acetylglucosaminyl deacetylase